jgi:ATP-dependent RNA helicase DHX57
MFLLLNVCRQWKDNPMCAVFLFCSRFNRLSHLSVPQYILESYENSEAHSKAPYIIVTQPRRISAISVAQRVSEERGNDGTVGYTIRGSSSQRKTTQLLFCTTGVILRRLSNGDQLQDVSHVIVDEVKVPVS